MKFEELNLKSGKWLVANCGNFPSEKNCKLILMAPENQRNDLLEAVIDHAVKFHGHKSDKELRTQLNNFLETVEV